MMTGPTLQQIEQARATHTEQYLRLLPIDDERARRHADVLRSALEECDVLIRDARRAVDVRAQREIAPASSKGGSQMKPIRGPKPRYSR